MKYLILKKHIDLKFIKRMVGWHLKYYFLGRGTPASAGVYIIDVFVSFARKDYYAKWIMKWYAKQIFKNVFGKTQYISK